MFHRHLFQFFPDVSKPVSSTSHTWFCAAAERGTFCSVSFSSRLCDTNLKACQWRTLLIVAWADAPVRLYPAPTTIDEIWTAFPSVFTFPHPHSCFSGWKRPRARCLSLLYAASRHEVIRIVEWHFFGHFEECNGVKVTSPVISELIISWWWTCSPGIDAKPYLCRHLSGARRMFGLFRPPLTELRSYAAALICPIVKDGAVIWSHSLLSIYLQHQHLFLVMFGLLCGPLLANCFFFIFKFALAPFNRRLWESLSSWKATGNGRAHQIRLLSPPVWISDTHFLHLRYLCLQHAVSSQMFFSVSLQVSRLNSSSGCCVQGGQLSQRWALKVH